MKNSFLDQILNDLSIEDPSVLKDWCFVFPTKRARVYFKKILAERFKQQAFWAPQLLSVEEFMVKCTGKSLADEITLLFELYGVYQVHESEPNFDRFYSWGLTLLEDFNEVDKYLVEAKVLYGNLQEIEELESRFGAGEITTEVLEQFSSVLTIAAQSNLISEFLNTWSTVGKVYQKFKDTLETKSLAYSGMLYRELASRVQDPDFQMPFQKVVFCGLNALSTAEEVILETLLDKGVAEAYWDADQEFLENPQEEAGLFLRKYKRKWQHSGMHWIYPDTDPKPKEIHVIGTAQMASQTKVGGQILKEKLENNELDPQTTAMILGSESLLFPMLYALPELEGVNVTMGYPLAQTGVFSLVQSIIKIHLNRKGKPGNVIYRGGDIYDFLAHPLIIRIAAKSAHQAGYWIRAQKINWTTGKKLTEMLNNDFLAIVIREPAGSSNLLDMLIEFLVKSFYITKGDQKSGLEEELMYHFVKYLNQLKVTLARFDLSPSALLLSRLLLEVFKDKKVPFSGEPLSGLQIMGFLESRTLDFEDIFILGVNENILPVGRHKGSIIPFALRKSFGLPTFEEQDAIYAYHFKRLLLRASRVHIFYNTEVAIDGSGEKSRFILQLLEQSDPKKVKIEQYLYQFPIDPEQFQEGEINVIKTNEIQSILKRYLAGSDQGKPISPTALSTYLDCPLRFYYRHIAEIPEPEELREDADARDFGIIVHNALESLYMDHQGKLVNRETIQNFLQPQNIQKIVEESFRKEFFLKEDQVLEGRNLLNASIISRLIQKVLENDLKIAPFNLIAVESRKFNNILEIEGGFQVKIGGTIDRVDEIEKGGNRLIRIIDYKTGKVDFLYGKNASNSDYAAYLEHYFTQSKYKAGFQAYFYAYLYHKLKKPERMKVGIYGLKQVNRGIRFLREDQEIPSLLLTEFEGRLKMVVQELFDPEIPFYQTSDQRNCRFCPYATLCRKI